MARQFRPQAPFDVALKLLIPTITRVKGVPTKSFPDPKNVSVFFGSFRTFGGTENISNDVYTVFDTAIVDTWYDPKITSDCRVYVCETGDIYDIITPPENIGMRHQYMQFKMQKVGGKP